MNKIQKPDVVVIIGAGGVSFYAAVALLRDTALPIVVIDPDTVSGTGATRLPYAESPTTRKIDLLSTFSLFAMGGRQPLTSPTFAASSAHLMGLVHQKLGMSMFCEEAESKSYLILDGTDMSLVQKRSLFEPFIDQTYPLCTYLRGSYDGNGWVVVSHGLPFASDAGVGGYTRIPTLAQSLVAGGILAQAAIQAINGEPLPYEYQVNTNTGECLSTWREE